VGLGIRGGIMHQLNVGEKVEFEIINLPGVVHATQNEIDIRDLFRVVLDKDEFSTVELRGYVRDQDGKFITTYRLNEDGNLEMDGALNKVRKFIVSGKIELTLEEEIFDETS